MTISASDETDTLNWAIRGDEDALEQLLRHHHARLHAYVCKLVGRNSFALVTVEDVIQETFIEAFQGITRFQPTGDGGFFSWIATIAHGKFMDGVRAAKALKRGGGRTPLGPGAWTSESMAALLDQLSSPGHTPSRFAAAHEAITFLQMALARLKREYREALQLRYLESKSILETSQLMRRTPKAIEHLCSRGIQILRDSLGSGSRF